MSAQGQLAARRALERVTVALRSAAGERLGTGLVVSREGHVLTCHHVVAGLSEVCVVKARLEHDQQAIVRVDPDNLSADFDLAVLKVDWTEEHPFPLYPTEAVAHWYAIGFQDTDLGWEGGVTLAGTVALESETRYQAFCSGEDRSRSYRLPRSLHLRGDAIHGGTSGAAVIDADTHCVVGVVVSTLTDLKTPGAPVGRGVAVPLTVALNWPPLARLLQMNAALVPRYGAALNELGATRLLAAQRSVALGAMFDATELPRLRLRAGAAEILTQFLSGDATLLPVVGASGCGKSSLLALLANLPAVPFAVLLRGIDMQREDGSIAAQIDRALLEVAASVSDLESATPRTTAILLSDAVTQCRGRLVIFFDAMNEHDDSLVSVKHVTKSWLPASVKWLCDCGAKLVISCRSETWTQFFQGMERHMFHAPKESDAEVLPFGLVPRREGGVWVGDFTDVELDAMLSVYELHDPDDVLDRELARHPFFLYLAADAGESATSRLAIVEQALQRRIEDIARARKTEYVSSADVWPVVHAIAESLLCSGHQVLSLAAAREISVSLRLFSELVDVGILSRTGTGFRFRFDPYLESQQSRCLVLPDCANFVHSWEPAQISHPALRGAIAFAAERLLEDESASDVYRAIAVAAGPATLQAELLLEAGRLGEDGYGWRRKDWATFSESYRGRFKTPIVADPFRAALDALAASDWRALTQALLGRLDDQRPVIGRHNRESTVASLAGGCLTVLYLGHVPELCEALAANAGSLACSVLEVIATEDPQTFLDWALRSGAPSVLRVSVIDAVSTAAARADDAARRRAIDGLHTTLSSAAEPEADFRAALALRRLDPADLAAHEVLLGHFDAATGSRARSAALAHLFPLPAQRVGHLLERLIVCIDKPAAEWNIHYDGIERCALQALGRAEMIDAGFERIAAIAARSVGLNEDVDGLIATWVARAGHRHPGAARGQALSKLMGRCLDSGSEAAQFSCALAAFGDLSSTSAIEAAWRHMLVGRSLSERCLSWACRQVLQADDLSPAERLGLLLPLRAANGPAWDDGVIAGWRDIGWRNLREEVEVFQAVWRDLPAESVGPSVDAMQKALDDGWSLKDAIEFAADL